LLLQGEVEQTGNWLIGLFFREDSVGQQLL
jgi:hypothetical protein